jgi:hypothetical protein
MINLSNFKTYEETWDHLRVASHNSKFKVLKDGQQIARLVVNDYPSLRIYKLVYQAGDRWGTYRRNYSELRKEGKSKRSTEDVYEWLLKEVGSSTVERIYTSYKPPSHNIEDAMRIMDKDREMRKAALALPRLRGPNDYPF